MSQLSSKFRVLMARFKVAYLLVALLHGYLLWASLSNRSYLIDDSVQYLRLAENLWDHGTFSQSFSAPFSPDLQRTPGYPILLLLLGRSPELVVIFQHGLLFVGAWLIYGILSKAYSSRTGRIGAIIFLLQPYPALFAGYILSEVPFTVLLLAMAYGFARYWRGEGVKWLAMSVLALSCAVLIRPVGLPLLGLLGFASVWRAWRLRLWQAPAAATLCLAIPLLVIGPWLWRNHRLSDEWVLSTMGPMNLVHGRLGGLEAQRLGVGSDEHALYMAGDSIAATKMGWQTLKFYPPEKQTHETEQLASGMGAVTIRFWISHPVDAIWFQIRSMGVMLAGLGRGWAYATTQSTTLSLILGTLQLLINLFNFVGVLLAWRHRRKWNAAEGLLLAVVSMVLVASSVAWADGRYRAVVDPLMTCMGAFAVWALEDRDSHATALEVHDH